MKKRLMILFATIIVAVFAANADIYFRGSVGKYGVGGSIGLYNGGYVSGNYGYNGHSGSLNLSGSWWSIGNNKYKVTMTETDSKGKVSGSWNLVYNSNNRSFTGTMTNSKGKTYKVNLKGR